MRLLCMICPGRYGLPVNYQALLLQTDRKRSKKLKDELSSLFEYLDPTASTTDVSDCNCYNHYSIALMQSKMQNSDVINLAAF